MLPTKIDFSDLDFVRVGNAQDDSAQTGVTVFYFPGTATAGADISGGGPASRETPVIMSETAPTPVNAVVLSGGSAYGLAASDGVMSALEENNIGFQTGAALVPIVVQSCIYDLGLGSAKIRPDSKMGKKACLAALEKSNPVSGSVGGGRGATCGKIRGMELCSKTGIGYAAYKLGDLLVGAAVIVNALGDLFDPSSGKKISGLKGSDGNLAPFSDFMDSFYELQKKSESQSAAGRRSNTTIGIIVTNGDFAKNELAKIAAMAQNAYARCIRPVSTNFDGDTIYACSSVLPGKEKVKSDINVAGALAAQAMQDAILDAVKSVES